MFTKEVKKLLTRHFFLSKPQQVINEGLPTEALAYSKERFKGRIGDSPLIVILQLFQQKKVERCT
jgi:hypothetical protein